MRVSADGNGPGQGEGAMLKRRRMATSPDVRGEDRTGGITGEMKQVLTATG